MLRRTNIATGIVIATLATAAPAAGGPPSDARVQGTFAMTARVTTAVNVRGERPGQTLHRTWVIVPGDCVANVCAKLFLTRTRSEGRIERLTLHRTGPGRYAGSGDFWVALRCRGYVHRLGQHVPFRLTLRVAGITQVQQVMFARRVTATYLNERRSDTTPCPNGPSHDAATYTGTDTTPVPAPPNANYTDTVDPATETGSFTDTSQPGRGSAPIVTIAWNFGDPASGAANTSGDPNPQHQFSAPGTYTVTLTVTDGYGLSGTSSQTVTVPPPPPPPLPSG